MTFGELQTLVSTWLDDLNYGYFTQDQVKTWLNNAQFTVQKRLLKPGQMYYMKPVQTNLVINQNDYVLPQDFWKLHRLEVILSGTPPDESKRMLDPITPNQQNHVSTRTGTPSYYFLKRNRLVVYPTPDDTLVMRLYYSYRVTKMTLDTDEPDVPEQFHELIALEAALDGFLRDERPPELLMAKKKAFEEDMDESADERNEDVGRGINMVDPDGSLYY